MSDRSPLVAWQPVLTDHQAYTFQALAREAAVPLIAYVTAREDSVRKLQGWTDTQVSALDRRLIPERGFLRYCYQQLRTHRTAIHFFCSPFQSPRLMLCLLLAVGLRLEFYLISEPYSPGDDHYFSDDSRRLGKIKAMLRPWLYRVYASLLRRPAAGVFAISRLALTQYRQAGMPSGKLFPFGYFVPSVPAPAETREAAARPAASGLRIIFVGSLIRRKGVDVLIAAARRLFEQGCDVTVDIYGPGDGLPLRHDTPALRYCGTIPFGQAQAVMARYDLLVLPSRHDGWGVVVNEALCAGVPVVCSDTTGAGEVAESLGAGLRFSSGNAESLSDVLARLIRSPALLQSLRSAAPQAARALQPEVAARYLLEVMQAPAARKASIPSPWYPDRA
jgi:glycosyltransferase involved in cell wall biosynthesis